ncbi:MAG: RNA polymerase sigma factor [Chloroflexota bacterium]|nr:RNA polymerase sigma factor [Chloroflexota bacterium]
MSDEHVLFADHDSTGPVPLEAVDRTDGQFRVRLEQALEYGYQLATVILTDEQDAEDVTHDAVERAWRARGSLRDPERFDAWFQRIVVNACRDRLRLRRSVPSSLSADGAAFLRDVLPHPGRDLAAASATRHALDQALRLLSDEQRIVVVLRFYLDLEIDEIARRCGMRTGTVKSRLHRALKQLRAAWEAAERREAEELR